MAKKDDEESARYFAEQHGLQRAGEKLLDDVRLIPVDDFDKALLKQFRKQFAAVEFDTTLVKGSSRTRAENCIDWVKANLTKAGWTRYITIHKVRHIAWLPPGVIQLPQQGQHWFYNVEDVNLLVAKLLEKFKWESHSG